MIMLLCVIAINNYYNMSLSRTCREDHCDVIKQNESELTNTVFKIQPNKADSFFCFLLFVQSFNCIGTNCPISLGLSTKLKPKQYPNRKCKNKQTNKQTNKKQKQTKNIFWLQTHHKHQQSQVYSAIRYSSSNNCMFTLRVKWDKSNACKPRFGGIRFWDARARSSTYARLDILLRAWFIERLTNSLGFSCFYGQKNVLRKALGTLHMRKINLSINNVTRSPNVLWANLRENVIAGSQ